MAFLLQRDPQLHKLLGAHLHTTVPITITLHYLLQDLFQTSTFRAVAMAQQDTHCFVTIPLAPLPCLHPPCHGWLMKAETTVTSYLLWNFTHNRHSMLVCVWNRGVIAFLVTLVSCLHLHTAPPPLPWASNFTLYYAQIVF